MSEARPATVSLSASDADARRARKSEPAPIRVHLDLARLEPFAQLAWLHYVAVVFRACGTGDDVVVHAGNLHKGLSRVPEMMARQSGQSLKVECGDSRPAPDRSEAFVYFTDSAALTRKVIRRFPRLYIAPTAAPAAIDTAVFAFLHRPGLLDELEGLAGAGDTPGLAERLPAYRAGLVPALPRVTLITSVFDGDLHLPQFLDNTSRLHGYGDCQHLLVNAGSPGAEHDALIAYAQRHRAAVYINLPRDPGLYEVWNLGVELANGRYLSNANLDDRRAPEQLERLCAELDQRPDIDVVSSPLRVAKAPNTDWPDSEGCPVMFREDAGRHYDASALFKLVDGRLRARSLPHCMPVWRRELHATHGFFDEAGCGASADWEFWLRVGASGARFLMLDEPLGVFLHDPSCYSRRDAGQAERDTAIAERYRYLFEGNVAACVRPRPAPDDACLERLRDDGAALELIVQLARRMSATHCGSAPADGEVVDGPAKQLAGLPDSVFSAAPDQIWTWLRALLISLAEVSWRGGPGAVAPGRALPVLAGVCADAFEVTRDRIWLLIQARLLGLGGDADAERGLLRYLHAVDRRWFWETVQTVYRFDVPLHRLTVWVDEPVREAAPTTAVARDHRDVWYYPDYRNNRYQALLYEPLQSAGGRVFPVADLHELQHIHGRDGRGAVLHLHWLNAVHRGFSGALAERRVSLLLSVLRRLRARGVELWWTVHNRYSHRAADRDMERWLMCSVYDLVDRVFVHHPLAVDELDWLPGSGKVSLLEHGPYPVEYIDRDVARRELGLEPEQRLLVHVGMVRDYKGLERFLPALRRALDRHPALRILIAGEIASREVRSFLKASPHRRLVVHDRYIPDGELARILSAADAGFLSYRSILTSGTQFHLLSSGVPVIAPALGTLPAYVVDGWNGYCYRDEAELDGVLDNLMALPGDALARMRTNARHAGRSLEWRLT